MFKPVTTDFEVGPERREFTFRKPTAHDGFKIIAEKQKLCFENMIAPDAINVQENDYMFDAARLNVCLESAPEEWYIEEKGPDDKPVKRINVMNENIDHDELQGVMQKVNDFLFSFRNNGLDKGTEESKRSQQAN